MPVDDRLRDGLRRNAGAASPQTERALQSTLDRARRRSRVRRTAVGLVVAAAAGALAFAGPSLTDGLRTVTPPPAMEPTTLSGSWAAQIAPGRSGVANARLAGTWTLTFTTGGALNATPPGAYRGTLAGDRYRITTGGFRTNLLAADACATAGSGAYRVEKTRGGIAFHVQRDGCTARVALLAGHPWMPTRPGASCVNNGGGACLGDLAAGTYRTTQFRPTVTYTVPAGWTNTQDLPGSLLFQPAGADERFIGIYRNVTVPDGCAERADPEVGTSIDSITARLTKHPGLTVSNLQKVTVGELAGIRLDVALASGWRGTCPFSSGRPVVAILFGNGPSALHHVLLPGFTERLYLLTTRGGNIAVEVAPEGRSLDELLTVANPLLSSLRFHGD